MFGYQGKISFKVSQDQEYLTDNPNRRCPDITKARTLLGYEPRVSVEEGIQRYLEFLNQSSLKQWR